MAGLFNYKVANQVEFNLFCLIKYWEKNKLTELSSVIKRVQKVLELIF